MLMVVVTSCVSSLDCSMLKHMPGPVVPLYHPTSVLLVDDNADFLRSMQLVLQSAFECFAFRRPAEAISFVRAESPLLTELQPPVGLEADSDMEHIRDPEARSVHLRVSRLPRLFANKSRFARTSVLVTDYVMPEISGLQMLESIRDLPMRKVLLSGLDDDDLGRRAVETGLVDAFYPKHHPHLHDNLAELIKTLQFNFFLGVTRPFQSALATGDARFLNEKAFRQVFNRFVAERNIIEHCVLMQPPGILGLNENGACSILLVADEDYRQASFEIAQAEGAPVALLRHLISPDGLAVFPTRTGFYSREIEASWRQFIWPSVEVGQSGLRVATIDDPVVVGRVCNSVASYAEHRHRRLN